MNYVLIHRTNLKMRRYFFGLAEEYSNAYNPSNLSISMCIDIAFVNSLICK